MNRRIKCPQCGEIAFTTDKNYKGWVSCPCCGLETSLAQAGRMNRKKKETNQLSLAKI